MTRTIILPRSDETNGLLVLIESKNCGENCCRKCCVIRIFATLAFTFFIIVDFYEKNPPHSDFISLYSSAAVGCHLLFPCYLSCIIETKILLFCIAKYCSKVENKSNSLQILLVVIVVIRNRGKKDAKKIPKKTKYDGQRML